MLNVSYLGFLSVAGSNLKIFTLAKFSLVDTLTPPCFYMKIPPPSIPPPPRAGGGGGGGGFHPSLCPRRAWWLFWLNIGKSDRLSRKRHLTIHLLDDDMLKPF